MKIRPRVNTLKRIVELLSDLSDEEVLSYRAAVDIVLRNRNLSYSTGELGEKLTISYFNSTPGLPNLQPAPTGTKNVDALSRNGDRYSIKTLWSAKKTGTIYPDPDNPEKRLFEFLLIVRLDKNLGIEGIYQFTWESFIQVRSWDKRMSAWYVSSSQRNLQAGVCVTSQ